MNSKKLLLTSVFGPYGVDNKYGKSLGMQMELLDNQVTRGQGVHSPRQSYLSFGLYLIAENISIPTTVLDFPVWKDFIKELKNGYTHIGITFIPPNILKVKRMCEYIRKHYPKIEIILGGYGVVIPNLEKIVPFDHLSNGEGVIWMRKFFNEDLDKPLKHPVLKNPIYSRVYGINSEPRGSVLLTGVGCKNGCSFCVTSHMFNKSYLPLLKTADDVFNTCLDIEKKLNVQNFMIMDENFLMVEERAKELLKLMEKNMKTYVFVLFCSANLIKKLGVDFFVRMGISRVWIGVESMTYQHEKVKGIDVKGLISELRSKGIVVLASTILFQEHHDYETIEKEIKWVNSLDSDMVQFMNYMPIPSTTLYKEMKESNRLNNLPYEKQSGAMELAFEHPYIKNPKQHISILKNAFKSKYHYSGPAIFKMAQTALMGYQQGVKELKKQKEYNLVWNSESLKYEVNENWSEDSYLKKRIEMIKKEALRYRVLLKTALIFSPNRKIKQEIKILIKEFSITFGKMSFSDKIKSNIVKMMAIKESFIEKIWKLKGYEGIIHQPPMIKTVYRE